MGEFLDWLLNDPTQTDGGFLARLLDPARMRGTATPGASDAPMTHGGSGALLGESPLARMLRGGLAGWGSAEGHRGIGPRLGAGAAAALRARATRAPDTGAPSADRPPPDAPSGEPACRCGARATQAQPGEPAAAGGEGAPAASDSPASDGAKMPAPTAGAVLAGHRYLGGDPTDPRNWQKLS